MLGVACRRVDFLIRLPQELLGASGVSVHIPAVGLLGAQERLVCLVAVAFRFGKVGMAAPQTGIMILRDGDAARDDRYPNQGAPDAFASNHGETSVAEGYQKPAKIGHGRRMKNPDGSGLDFDEQIPESA